MGWGGVSSFVVSKLHKPEIETQARHLDLSRTNVQQMSNRKKCTTVKLQKSFILAENLKESFSFICSRFINVSHSKPGQRVVYNTFPNISDQNLEQK